MLGWRLGLIVVLSLALWPRRRCRGSVENWLGAANNMATSRQYRTFIYVRYFFVSNLLSRKKTLQVAAHAEADNAPLPELRECPCAQRYSQRGELQIDILNVYQEWVEAVFFGLLRSSKWRVAHICAISRNPVKQLTVNWRVSGASQYGICTIHGKNYRQYNIFVGT